MKFSRELVMEAMRFRQSEIRVPYLAVHMRRGDFLSAHKDLLPPIKDSVEQIKVCSMAWFHASSIVCLQGSSA